MPRLREAACKDSDPSVFYGDHICGPQCDGPRGCFEAKGEQGRFERIKQAKAICQKCPEQEACADWAIQTDQPYGVWGGLTERARKEIRRQMRTA